VKWVWVLLTHQIPKRLDYKNFAIFIYKWDLAIFSLGNSKGQTNCSWRVLGEVLLKVQQRYCSCWWWWWCKLWQQQQQLQLLLLKSSIQNPSPRKRKKQQNKNTHTHTHTHTLKKKAPKNKKGFAMVLSAWLLVGLLLPKAARE
jgi:hypothetical protein